MEAVARLGYLGYVREFSTRLLRIAHKMGAVDAVVHRLTMIEDLPEELRSSHISLKEAEKELKGGAKAYLYLPGSMRKGILTRILPLEGILTRILALMWMPTCIRKGVM